MARSNPWEKRCLCYTFFLLLFITACYKCQPVYAKTDKVIACKGATFQILCYTKDASGNTVRNQGTGIWSGRGRLIVTNAHVIDSAEAIFIVDHSKKIVKGEVYKKSSMLDIAIIKASEEFSLPALDMEFIPENNLKKGASLFTIHYDSSLNPVVLSGSYRGIKKLGDFALLDISMKLNFGSSGSGVFTKDGKVAGMVVGTRNLNGYQGYILPAGELNIILDELDYIFFRKSMAKRKIPFFDLPDEEFLTDEKETLVKALSMYRQQEYMKANDLLAKIKGNHVSSPELAVFSAALLVRMGADSMAINELVPWHNMGYSSYVFFYAGKIYDEIMDKPDEAIKFYKLSMKHLKNYHLKPLIQQRIRLLEQ